MAVEDHLSYSIFIIKIYTKGQKGQKAKYTNRPIWTKGLNSPNNQNSQNSKKEQQSPLEATQDCLKLLHSSACSLLYKESKRP